MATSGGLSLRLLFCLCADDTTIFEKDTFVDLMLERTEADDSGRISEYFHILNTLSSNSQSFCS